MPSASPGKNPWFIVPRLNIKKLGIPKYFGPDNINSTNRDPEVFREKIPMQQSYNYTKSHITEVAIYSTLKDN